MQAIDDDGGKFCLLFCGNANCAGEFLQLLGDLQKSGIKRFVIAERTYVLDSAVDGLGRFPVVQPILSYERFILRVKENGGLGDLPLGSLLCVRPTRFFMNRTAAAISAVAFLVP